MVLATAVALAAQIDASTLVTIQVAAETRHTPAHSITISSRAAVRPRTQSARDDQFWIASRSWDGGSQSLTSEACPALRTVALSLRDLQSVPVSPPFLTVAAGESLPIPPTIKDGYTTTLEFRVVNSDGSETDVRLSGGTDYQRWGNAAVAALIPCWGPLLP